MPTGSPAGQINSAQVKQVLKTGLFTAISALLTYLISALPGLNLGQWAPLVLVVLNVVLHGLDKFLPDNQA